jgi:hypothetical protein
VTVSEAGPSELTGVEESILAVTGEGPVAGMDSIFIELSVTRDATVAVDDMVDKLLSMPDEESGTTLVIIEESCMIVDIAWLTIDGETGGKDLRGS